jgi:hypothetical protein
MMEILLVFAFVFFVIGTFASYSGASPWYGRFNWISAGLACWVATLIFSRWPPR